MAYSYSVADIQKGYEALTTYEAQDKINVHGGPARKDFYYARLVYFLIVQTKARAGDVPSQQILSSIPCAAVKNGNPFTVYVTYNNEKFDLATGEIVCLRQNEAEFIVDRARENRQSLEIVDLSQFFANGKPTFFYW